MFQEYKQIRKKNFTNFTINTMSLIITTTTTYNTQKSLQPEELQQANNNIASFDPIIQKTTDTILKKYITKFNTKNDFILVADSQTKQLLTITNRSSDTKMKNKSWALSFKIKPASVMKDLVATSTIEKDILKADDKFDCENGSYNYNNHTFRDQKHFETLTTTKTIIHSNNIYSIKIGDRLGASGLKTSLKGFGFKPKNSTTNFPKTKTNHYPKLDEIADSDFVPMITTNYNNSPGFQITPLEILQAYNTIANDGKLMKPMNFSKNRSSPIMVRQTISTPTTQKIKAILSNIIKINTKKNAQSSLYSTAGKTSTAYNPKSIDHDSINNKHEITDFVNFTPIQNSRLVVYIKMIDPTSSSDKQPHNNKHTTPIFKEIIKSILQQIKIPSNTNTF